jgi:hypothetical protein
MKTATRAMRLRSATSLTSGSRAVAIADRDESRRGGINPL